MRCRPGTAAVCGGPGSAVHRSTSLRAAPRPGHAIASEVFGALFIFQTASFVPAARFPRPGFCNFASLTRIEGWAERRETFGCSAEHPLGLHMTRQARRLRGALRPIARQDARERAYDAGRSPLGAPPWRFWAPGAALLSPAFAPDRLQRAPRSQVVVPGGRLPGPPEASGYGAARRRTPRLAPHSGSSLEHALNERGCGSSSINSLRSQ